MMASFTDVETWRIEDVLDSLKPTPKKKKRIQIPSYQRNLVWKQQQKRELIDSIKRGMPFGAILLYHEGAEDKTNIYQLIDGLQRTTTIKSYDENPNEFFNENDLDESFINIIHKSVQEHYDISKEEIIKTLVEWVRTRKGFSETDKFSSYELTKYIKDKLCNTLTMPEMDSIIGNVSPYLKSISENSIIKDIKVPVIVYSGDTGNLPTIFERMNSNGTQLSKYQIYAATWIASGLFEIKNTAIIEKIKGKYDALVENGLEIQNYDPINFNTSKFNFFEYFFGLGKLLVDEFPMLFGGSAKDDQADSIGFNLGFACLHTNTKPMSYMPEYLKLQSYEVAAFEAAILDSVNFVNNTLKPFISLRANKKHNTQSNSIYHSEMQVISMIGKVFISKYDINLNTNPSWNEKADVLKRLLPHHYLYDIMRNYWSGSGDSKSTELIKSSRYESEIKYESWEAVLNDWHTVELDKKEKSRSNIKTLSVLFLKYIYTHLLTIHEELSSTEFELEHIIPIARMKSIASINGGMAMSSISNLCLIEKKINRDKGDRTFYEHYNMLVANNEMTRQQADSELKKIEDRSFTTNQELIFLNKLNTETTDTYENYLVERFEKLKNKFYSLNNIKSNVTN